MADEKKPGKSAKSAKPAKLGGGGGGSSDRTVTEELVFLFAGLLILGAIATAVLNFIHNLDLSSSQSLWARFVRYFFEHIWPIWKLIAVLISGLSIAGIIHNSWKLRAINIEEQPIYNPSPSSPIPEDEVIIEPKNERWEKVIKYANSESESDWRLAIIEADVILEELLHTLGFVGESVGDILKSIDKSEFLTIEDAWEAHRVRNAIAHSGGNFKLNQHETKRVISLFEKVFREFRVI